MKHLHQILQQKYQFYHNWHQTKHHNKIHCGALVVLVLFVFSSIFNFTEQIYAQTDTIAPSIPTNLTAQVISSSQINPSWTASTDGVGVAGYKIYRDSSLLFTVNSSQLTYSDTSLQPSIAYSYTVSAYDAAGNESEQSSSASAATLSGSIPGDLDGEEVEGYISPEQDITLKSDAADKLNYAPGEIIIKFKDDAEVGTVASELIERGQNFQSITDSPDLDNLNRKFKVKKMKRILGGDKEETIQSGYISKTKARQLHQKKREEFSKKVKNMREKFVRRAKRAPKDAEAPYLNHIYKLEFEDKTIDIEAACAEYAKDPKIEYAQPNYIYEIFMYPNDPYFATSGSWGQGYDDLWGLKKINTEQAWDHSQGTGITVAVVDTGIDYNHEDIASNVWLNLTEIPSNGIDDDTNGYIDDNKGWDFAYGDNDPLDRQGHGTHTSGTIAAIGNNLTGVIGVAPQAKVMAVKGLNDSGSGFTSQLAESLRYAADNGADVISNSWGGGASSQVMKDAVDYAYAAGCVLVFAAGNSNMDVANFGPANLTNVISVAASDQNDAKAYFSNWGVKIDVAAPGGGTTTPPPTYAPQRNILSLRAEGTGDSGLVVGAKYLRQAGTSMACPHVSGFAALILSKNPAFTNEEIRQVIRVSADDLGDPGWDKNFGYGRINTYAGLLLDSVGVSKISSPQAYAIVNGFINISGTASGSNFNNYKVEYGIGDNPLVWTELATGFIPKQNDILVSNWDTTLIGDGKYTIKLTITDIFGKSYEDRILVTTQNTYITSPQERNFLSAQSGVIEIKGRAVASTFINYTIEYFPVDDSGSALEPATNVGITLANGGNLPVVDGLLGTLDTGVITTAGIYTFRLTKFASVTDTYEVRVYLDPLLKQGWPQQISPYSIGPFMLGFSTHTLADINNDGRTEIIIGYGELVYVFTDNGQSFPGWPQMVDSAIQSSPVAADLDGDGFMEIVSGKGKYVWHYDGTLVAGWPNLSLSGKPVIEDINGDGNLDIVLLTPDSTAPIYAVDINGNALPGWPISNQYGYIYTDAVIGDVDKDGKKEIVFVAGAKELANEPHIHIVNSDGTLEVVGPKLIPSRFKSSILLGDLDVDGDLEIIIAFREIDSKSITVFHHNGSNMAGWPITLSNPLGYLLTEINPPTLGDIDGDGRPEIFIGVEDEDQNSLLYAFRYDGLSVNSGWPKMLGRSPTWINIYGSYFGFGTAAVADIDGDGKGEVFASYNSPYVSIQSSEPGFFTPYTLRASMYGANSENTPALADVDGDGKIEIVWVDFNFRIFVWDLADNYDPTKIEWGQFLHDRRHTGLYVDPKDTISPSVPADLTAMAISSSQIDLSWTASTDNIRVAGYRIYRDGVQIDTTALTSYSDIGLSPSTTYNYQVAGYDATGNVSAKSPLVSAITFAPSNQPPVLDPIGNKNVDESQLLSFIVTASDSDANDVLSYTVSSLPAGAIFNPATHTFSWTPGFDQAGSYPLTFSVIDIGGLTDSEAITITVNNVNQVPIANAGPDQTVLAGNAVLFNGSGSIDPDGSIVSYSWNFGDGGSGSGVSPTHIYTIAGTYSAVLTVTDNNGAADTDNSVITVEQLTITSATYSRKQLTVYATSSLGAGAGLKISVSGTTIQNVAMTYTNGVWEYKKRSNTNLLGRTVTITSMTGTSASAVIN